MQSNQFKSDSLNSNLNLNSSFLESRSTQSVNSSNTYNVLDSTLIDSLNANYIAPDSIITFGYKPEWSQFRKAWEPEYNYKKELIQPLPYDSLYTVLKGVEVVFPGKKLLKNNPDWLVGILVISFLLFASVRLIFNKYLSQLMQALVNYSAFTRLLRERYFNILHASFRLDIIFNTILALFIYQFVSLQKINFGIPVTFYVYLICLGIVIGYFTLKRIVYYLVGILTENQTEVQEYLFSITIFNRILGLFMIPVTATIAFVPFSNIKPILLAGLALLVTFYILSLLRGGKIFLKKQFSISYLILYLCTLEILPLVLIYNLLLI